MPAIAALTINDGLVTPVAHTFAPVTTDGTQARWADRSPSIPSGFKTLDVNVQQPNGNRTVYRWQAGFSDPKVEAVNGVNTVTRYNSAQVTLNIHPDSSVQDRKDLLAYVANCLGLASVKTSVENLEPFY